MPKCPMCSQEVLSRGRICQECEWELESARAWAENQDAREAAAAAAEQGVAQPPSLDDEGDASAAALPHSGAATAPEVLHGAAETSYNLWRTRRGAALLLAIAGSAVLVGFAALGPVTQPAQAHRSVMGQEPGMLPHCSDAAPAYSCLPSRPH